MPSIQRNFRVAFLLCVVLAGAVSSARASGDRSASGASPTHRTCGTGAEAALQILGSGGPLNPEGRASTSYLVWVRDRPSIVVDLGPGSLTELDRAGVTVTELDAVLISHLHPDHVAELPGLLWDEDILDRHRPLILTGPSAGQQFPDFRSFLEKLFGTDGAFPFMQPILDPRSSFHLDIRVIDPAHTSPSPIRIGAAVVTAYTVPHGQAPTLAYRVDVDGASVVFAGDQSGGDPGFATFAHHADVLVLHTALSATARGHPFARVIGVPQRLAALAAAAGVKQVVLSHLMAFPPTYKAAKDFSLFDPPNLLAAVRSVYRGPVSLASDQRCIALGETSH
ncbi:MAG TPA: MBL fold metallo-hydrolase [Steroidobacteraceae bacterium]|jgi:ribonuclease Z|nr:MBL fold metallo-hydrolase [Steroidobacteraceae bacterium]